MSSVMPSDEMRGLFVKQCRPIERHNVDPDQTKTLSIQIRLTSGIPSGCQTGWIQIRPDILSGLIWVHTVCKNFQQTILGGKVITQPVCKDTLLTLNAPTATKVVCFSHLLKCLSLDGKQCGPRSDCSYRSSLFWVHPVCFYT